MTGPSDAPAHLRVGEAIGSRTHRREAVRALAVDGQGRCLLLAEAGGGGLKFPGGGVEPGETDVECLARELREETGFDLAGVDRLVVVVDERRPGIEPDVVLAMQSRYYRVRLGARGAPALEEDEAALGLAVLWLPIDEALVRQRTHAADRPQPWAHRELAVLELLATTCGPR